MDGFGGSRVIAIIAERDETDRDVISITTHSAAAAELAGLINRYEMAAIKNGAGPRPIEDAARFGCELLVQSVGAGCEPKCTW